MSSTMQHTSQHCSKDCQAQSILPRLRSALFKDHSVNSTMDNGCVSLDLLCALSTPGQMFDQGVRHLLLKCDQCYHIFVKCNQWLRRDIHYKCEVFVKYLLGLHVISANIFTHSWTCKESHQQWAQCTFVWPREMCVPLPAPCVCSTIRVWHLLLDNLLPP